MDLHHLHRQARQASAARAGEEPGYSSKGQWDQYDARKVASEAARWKGEHDKMREVSTQLAYKYEQANQAYQSLKERHQHLRTNHEAMLARQPSRGDDMARQREPSRDAVHQELALKAEKWRALCGDARSELRTARAQAEDNREKLSKLRGELRAALDQVDKCSKLKSEIPKVRTQLQEALVMKSELESAKSASEKLMSDLATARKELKAAAKLESTKAGLKSASGLQSELESTKSRLEHLQGLEAELPIVKEKLKAGDAATRANDKLKAELAAAHEKLRAATHAASARAKQHTTDMQTCANMLANADQVLQACSALYQDKASPLGDALADTSTELSQFLKSLSARKPS